MSTEIEKADKSHDIRARIADKTVATANNLLELGKLFKTMRDEKLYRYTDSECGSFEEYLAWDEVAFGRSTVFSFIHVYELYVLKLGYDVEFLAGIGHKRLQRINPVVEKDPVEWIFKAKTLSPSDLRNEVRVAQGKEEIEIKREEQDVKIYDYKSYLEFIKAHPCITCGTLDSEGAHFPQSKGAGGEDAHRIPLCRVCHTQFHKDPFDFLWLNKNKIFNYFYDTFLEAFAIIRSKK